MPRGPRLDAPGALHHVMARGVDGALIFRDDCDHTDFVARLEKLSEDGAFLIYAWALVANHTHLLVRTGARPLSHLMRSLLTGYAGCFNRRHRRTGHLFQGRFKSIVCEDEPYFLELVRYIHLNPLRAGLVPDLETLERYPFTGHSGLLGYILRPWQATDAVLSQFGRTPAAGRSQYRGYVAAGVPLGSRPDLRGGGLVRSVGGWEAAREIRRGREAFAADERVLGGSKFVEALKRALAQDAARGSLPGPPITLESLVRTVAASCGVSPSAVLSNGRYRPCCKARDGISFLWLDVLSGRTDDLVRIFRRPTRSISRFAARGRRCGETWRALLASPVAIDPTLLRVAQRPLTP